MVFVEIVAFVVFRPGSSVPLHCYSGEGSVGFVGCPLRFVVIWLVFVECVALFGLGPGWLVLSMALQFKNLLLVLPTF